MTPRLPVALAVIGLVSTGALTTVLPAKAQQTSPKSEMASPKAENTTPKAQTSVPKEDEQAEFMLSPEDHAALVDAHIAALHAGLELTADQQKLWPPVEQALRDFSKLMYEQRQKRYELLKKRYEEKHPLDPVARLQFMSANMIARGEALKKVGDAAGPLYAALTDAQKDRLPFLMHAVGHAFGHGGHFGMMGGGPGFRMGPGWRGPGRMGPGWMGHGPMMGGPQSDDGEHDEE